MNPLALQVAVKLGLLAVLAGILARGRLRDSRAFTVYLVAVLTLETAASLFPDTFFVWDAWVRQQCVFDVCKLAVASELAQRAFRSFPGARTNARLGFSVIVVLSTLAMIAATPDRLDAPGEGFEAWWFTVEPRVVNGTIWLFVLTARLVLFHNLPWSDWDRAISLGFGTYLVIFVTVLNTLRALGWELREWVALVDGLAYFALTAWWACAAWRRGDVIPPALLRRVEEAA